MRRPRPARRCQSRRGGGDVGVGLDHPGVELAETISVFGALADEAGGMGDLLPASKRAEPAEEHGIGAELAYEGAEPALGREGGEDQLGKELLGEGAIGGVGDGAHRFLKISREAMELAGGAA